MNEHFPRLQFLVIAGCFVFLEIPVGEGLFELERNAPAHDADTVYRVHQRLGIRLQYVALFQFNHINGQGVIGSDLAHRVNNTRQKQREIKRLF